MLKMEEGAMGQKKVRIDGIITKPGRRRIVVKTDGPGDVPARDNLVDVRGRSNFRRSLTPSTGTGSSTTEPRSLINGKR